MSMYINDIWFWKHVCPSLCCIECGESMKELQDPSFESGFTLGCSCGVNLNVPYVYGPLSDCDWKLYWSK